MPTRIEANAAPTYPITVHHVRADERLWDVFGNRETEDAAVRLALCAQRRGGWHPFTLAELYEALGHNSFSFGRLLDNLIIREGDTYYFTHEFIARYYAAAPARLTR